MKNNTYIPASATLIDEIAKLKQRHEQMKRINKYYRENQTCEGCPYISVERANKINKRIAADLPYNKQPFTAAQLAINRARIHDKELLLKQLLSKEVAGQESPCI